MILPEGIERSGASHFENVVVRGKRGTGDASGTSQRSSHAPGSQYSSGVPWGKVCVGGLAN